MCMVMCMCMCNVYYQYCTCMAQVSGLSCGCCPCPRQGSPSATTTFLPCLPGTMLRAPLVSTSPSCSPSQCPVQPSPAACRKAQLQPPSFTFYVVHAVSEWQTILGQWPWQTAAAALVPTGHTKLYSSQLVSLSLWLNAWCQRFFCWRPFLFYLKQVLWGFKSIPKLLMLCCSRTSHKILPHGCSKQVGWVLATFGQCPKVSHLFEDGCPKGCQMNVHLGPWSSDFSLAQPHLSDVCRSLSKLPWI